MKTKYMFVVLFLGLIGLLTISKGGKGAAYYNLGGFWLDPCSSLSPGGAWVRVPGDAVWSTTDFCVMKYPAKNNGSGSAISQAAGIPWAMTWSAAVSACRALGAKFDLINNNQRMTLGANLADQPQNWSGGAVGSGTLNIGNNNWTTSATCAESTDDTLAWVQSNCTPTSQGGSAFNQRRTFYLSTGKVVWDAAGNNWQWCNYSNANDKPTPLNWVQFVEYTQPVVGTATMPLTQLRPTHAVKSWWNDSWNSSQGIGAYFSGSNGGNPTAPYLEYGGSFDWGSPDGLFSVIFDSATVNYSGFRCVYNGLSGP